MKNKLSEIYRAALVPERELSVSEWADLHRWLATGTSPLPGKWKTDVAPYLREPMDCLSPSSPIETVAIMKGCQTGFTEIGINFAGHVVAHSPGLILHVMPSLEDCTKLVRTRIDPSIAATPALRDRISPARSRDSGNTVHSKRFPGGVWNFSGSNSPSALRSLPIKYLICDEVDAYELALRDQGDAVSLAIGRTANYAGRGRKILMISTPTLKGISRIETAFERGDQRKYFCPCPTCREMQTLEWDNLEYETPAGDRCEPYLVCSANGCVIAEHEKGEMLAGGEWRPTATSADPKTASFHLSSLYAPLQSWGAIVDEYLAGKDRPETAQPWRNMWLGLSYEDAETAALSPEFLLSRCEEWQEGEIQDGVLAVVLAADIQGDRIECEFVGHGLDGHRWSIEYHTIDGDTSQYGRGSVWADFAELMKRTFRHPRKAIDLKVEATVIDAGFRPDIVCRFVAEHSGGRNLWAIRGRAGAGVPAWPLRAVKPNTRRVAPLYIVGVDALKRTVMDRLRSENLTWHFPAGRSRDYCEGLLSERLHRRYIGRTVRLEWIRDRSVRNEPLDVAVYSLAALHGLYARGFKLESAAARIEAAPDRKPDDEKQPVGRVSMAQRLAEINRL